MNETQVEQLSTLPPLPSEDIHAICCADEDKTLCGFDVSGCTFVELENADIACPVCNELQWSPICPFTRQTCPDR